MYSVERLNSEGWPEKPRAWWAGGMCVPGTPRCSTAPRDAFVWNRPEDALTYMEGIDDARRPRFRIVTAPKEAVEAKRLKEMAAA